VAEKYVKELSCTEAFLKAGEWIVYFGEKLKKGKMWVWIDEKFTDWIDEQTEVGKFRNQSHAIESLILKEMQKK